MSKLINIFGRISTSISDKQRSEMINLAKYFHLQELSAFPIINCLGYKISIIILNIIIII